MKKIIFIFILSVAIAACGVKGDPLPPIGEEKIGRGKPTYRRAAKKIALPDPGDEEEEEDTKE